MTGHKITREWRMTIAKQLSDQGMTQTDLAAAISTSSTTISRILSGSMWSSPLVPAIESVLGVVDAPSAAAPELSEDLTARIADLREARDAVETDIAQHEKIRDTVAARLAESYARRAELDAEISKLRGEAPKTMAEAPRVEHG